MTVVAYHEENHLNPYRTSLRGPLAEILALSPGKRVVAEPSDAPGCTAEFVVGSGWCGYLGSLPTLTGIPTTNLVSDRVAALVAGNELLFSSNTWIPTSVSGQSYNSTTKKTSFEGEVAAKNIRYAGWAQPFTFAQFGDSHLQTRTSAPVLYAPFGEQENNHCWVTPFCQLTKQRFFMVGNYAVGGKRADEVRSEQFPSVIAQRPDIGIMSVGTNDVIQSRTAAALIADAQYMCETMLVNSIIPWIYLGPTYTAITATPAAKLAEYRQWAYDYAARRPGVVVLDGYALSMDYASSVGAALTAHLRDGVHLGALGAYTQGKSFAAQIDDVYGSKNISRPSYVTPVEIWTSGNDVRQLYRFPGLPGTRVEGNAGVSGNTPGNGWYTQRSGTGAGVNSLATGTHGQVWTIACTGAALNDQVSLVYSFAAADRDQMAGVAGRSRFVVLEVLREYESLSGVIGDNWGFSFGIVVDGVTTNRSMVLDANYNTSASTFSQENRSVVLRSLPVEIPAGATTANGAITGLLKFGGAGAGTIKISEVRIIDVQRVYQGV